MSDSFVTPWAIAHQAPLSVGFSRQKHWSRLLFPPPRGSSQPWGQTHISYVSYTGRQILYPWATWKAHCAKCSLPIVFRLVSSWLIIRNILYDYTPVHTHTHTHTHKRKKKPKPCKQHFTYYTQCTVIFSGIFCSMGLFLLFLKWLLDLLNCFYGPHFQKYCFSSVHSDDDLMQQGMLLFSSSYWYSHPDCAACPRHSLSRLRQGLQPEGVWVQDLGSPPWQLTAFPREVGSISLQHPQHWFLASLWHNHNLWHHC